MYFSNRIILRIVILIILLTPIFYLGIGNKYPWIILGNNGVALGIITFFIATFAFVLLVFTTRLEKIYPPIIQAAFFINIVLSTLFILPYDFIQYKHFMRFGYQEPSLIYLADLFLIIGIGMTAILNKFLPAKHYFVIAVVFTFVHQVLSIYYFPLVIERSDMLGGIAASLHQFINGLSPYSKTINNVGIPPYLPFTILSFLPSVMLEVDLRWTGLLYWLVCVYLIYKKFNLLHAYSQMALCLLILNPYWIMRHDLYFQFFLLELVILLLYAKTLKWTTQVVLLGMFVVTLQFAWLLAPFILLAISSNILQVIKKSVLAVLLAVVLLFGFVRFDFTDFLHAAFLHQEFALPYRSDITFGLSTIFYFARNQYLLYLLQISIYFIFLVYAGYYYVVRKNRDYNFYIAMGALSYLAFMATNYFIETYLLIPVLLTVVLVDLKSSCIVVEDNKAAE